MEKKDVINPTTGHGDEKTPQNNRTKGIYIGLKRTQKPYSPIEKIEKSG